MRVYANIDGLAWGPCISIASVLEILLSCHVTYGYNGGHGEEYEVYKVETFVEQTHLCIFHEMLSTFVLW